MWLNNVMSVLCIAKYMEQAVAWVSFDCETRGVGYGLLVGGASTRGVGYGLLVGGALTRRDTFAP